MSLRPIESSRLARRTHPVYIAHVESPTLFWVHLRDSRERLLELQAELKGKMQQKANKYTLCPHGAYEGVLVAVKDSNEWYRGVIVKTNGIAAWVELGDWGKLIRRPLTQLHRLPEQYRKVEWQAISCGLLSLKPVPPLTAWSRKTIDICRLLLEEETGYVRLNKYGKVADIELFIVRPNNVEPNSFKEELKMIGQAVDIVESRTPSIPSPRSIHIIRSVEIGENVYEDIV